MPPRPNTPKVCDVLPIWTIASQPQQAKHFLVTDHRGTATQLTAAGLRCSCFKLDINTPTLEEEDNPSKRGLRVCRAVTRLNRSVTVKVKWKSSSECQRGTRVNHLSTAVLTVLEQPCYPFCLPELKRSAWLTGATSTLKIEGSRLIGPSGQL